MSNVEVRSSFSEEELNEICRIFQKTNALEFGTFKLPNGRTTPYYVDLRVISSLPETFSKVANIFINSVKKDLGLNKFDRVAGIPTAGIPFASLIAYHSNKPFFYIRQKMKLKGRERRIEGVLMPGDRVLLIDDLATTGTSLKKAVSSVRIEGGIVSDAFVLLDRQEGARKKLSIMGVNLNSVLNIKTFAKAFYEMNAVDEDQYNTIVSQVREK